MTNRTTTLNLKTMAAQHSWDLFGMKNLVTTMIPQLDSIMMKLLGKSESTASKSH